MSGKSQDGKVKNDAKKKMSRSAQAGLLFPVGRIHRMLHEGKFSGVKRISIGASICLAAILEYITAEMLEIAGNAATQNNRRRITPRHIKLAISHDEELDKLLNNVIIPDGGVMPNIHQALIPKKKSDNNNQVKHHLSQEL